MAMEQCSKCITNDRHRTVLATDEPLICTDWKYGLT